MSTSEREAQKRAAAERAVDLVQDGMMLGLGTGSTARHVLQVLAERRAQGQLQNIEGVATSSATERQAGELGIPVRALNDVLQLDLGIDGADEVDPQLDLIKGLGGALLWEKIVAHACNQFIVVVDDSKMVDRLGSRSPLPVEVIPFGWKVHVAFLERWNGQAELRRDTRGEPFVTDSGNYILDCRFPGGIERAAELNQALKAEPGVVETGLFLGMATRVIVAGQHGARLLTWP